MQAKWITTCLEIARNTSNYCRYCRGIRSRIWILTQ